ncbi:MAG: asparagine synthase (glutamine-hydrolyzing) [Fluviicola sp. XM-24bin1]|nr:MAG: asparagine synthase (glutamine-hydrolyzing) [Fluviicola sp. XM-24bin1]
MCGIAGFIDFNKSSDRKHIVAMTDTMFHRGPDGSDYQFLETSKAQIGLGHRRLSIIDLSEHGAQPMQFDDLWVTFNGEIYNFQEIKDELIKLGHKFTGGSDTEMILHAYQEWGVECVHRFIGMFAIVLVDLSKNEVYLLRDRPGVKPLFVYWNQGILMYASELKAFHEHPAFEKEIDKDAVSAFLQYGNVPSPHCIFKNCFKVKPGHYHVLKLDDQSISEKQYWNVYDAYNAPKSTVDYDIAKSEVKSLLHSAFNYRMVADVPVGVFLSGGFDSSCVTAILQSDRTDKLKTFTIGVPDIGLNEAPYAKDIAAHLGTDHHEFECTEKEVFEHIHDLPFYYDEPFADSSAIPTTLVSKMAREHVTVALSADGGDEIFAGYNRYDYLHRYSKKLNKIPGFVRQAMVGTMNVVPSNRIPVLRNKYNFHNRYEKLKQVLKNPSNREIMLSLSQQFTDKQMRKIMQHDPKQLETMFLSDELNMDINSPLGYMQAIDFQTYLLDDIMQKVDRATMTVSLEGREPLLDHRIVEYVAPLPDSYKYHDGIKKRMLRDIVYDYLPESLMDRPKMGFAIPIAQWLQTDLRDIVHDHINEKNITEQGLFDWKEIKSIHDAFYGGKKEYDMKLWYVLMFQMWYERWM